MAMVAMGHFPATVSPAPHGVSVGSLVVELTGQVEGRLHSLPPLLAPSKVIEHCSNFKEENMDTSR